MSYTRTFRKTIPVHYDGRVSYPSSQTGGSVSYSGTVYEDVEVEIVVDTDAFDASVLDCNHSVGTLTQGITTMNMAQCKSIADNADKVSTTIVDGFFKTVRSDLATQRAELLQTVDARLLLLRQQANTLKEKRENMENDYARTTARYQKIFSDLNNELSTRIHEIDQPVYKVIESIDSQNGRMLHTDLVQTAVTTSRESSILQAQLNAANTKHNALLALNNAKGYLETKALSDRTLNNSIVLGNGNDSYYLPVCYLESVKDSNSTTRECVCPVSDCLTFKDVIKENVSSFFADDSSSCISQAVKDSIFPYLQNEIADRIMGNDDHSMRIKSMINKLFEK